MSAPIANMVSPVAESSTWLTENVAGTQDSLPTSTLGGFHQTGQALSLVDGRVEGSPGTALTPLPSIASSSQMNGIPNATPKTFMDIPPEVRNIIYKMVFSLAGPVRLISDKDGDLFLTVKQHKLSCHDFRRHTSISRVEPNSTYIKEAVYCKEPFSRKTIELVVPPSVLAFLQTCKAINLEAMPFFYRLNNFVFGTPRDIATGRTLIPSTRRMHVRHITFAYQSTKTSDYLPAIATMFPNLKELSIEINIEHRGVIVNHHGPHADTLRSLFGINILTGSFHNLDALHLAGLDHVMIDGRSVRVDIDHPLAVGPELRKKMVKSQREGTNLEDVEIAKVKKARKGKEVSKGKVVQKN